MNEEELKEAARDARRALDRKREEIRERLDVREQKVEVEKQHLQAASGGRDKPEAYGDSQPLRKGLQRTGV